MVAELLVILVAVRAEMVGAVVSSTIVSVIAAVDQLPAPSMNWTYTVLVPAAVESVHVFVVAYASAVENEVPVLEKRICVTLLSASVADRVRVTVSAVGGRRTSVDDDRPGGSLVVDGDVNRCVCRVAGRIARTRREDMCSVCCRRRVPGTAVRRRRIFGAKGDAVQQELHASDTDIVGRGR